MNRQRAFAQILLASIAGFGIPTGTAQDLRLDVLIRGGRVIDGTGSSAVRTDVGISDDRIVFLGDAGQRRLAASRTIDATGLIVAPGFIDPHTHAAAQLANPRASHNQPYLYQGVTTLFVGNDGESPLDINAAFKEWQSHGIGTNVATFIGHGAVRRAVVGVRDVLVSAEHMAKMRALVATAMENGALGLSTSLSYVPGHFATTEEVIELSKVAAAYGGIYDTHLRSEDSSGIGLLASLEEALRIGREAKIPVHISHIKVGSADLWGQSKQVIGLINQARAQGLQITANQYPYSASSTGQFTQSLGVPAWALDGGRDELLKRLGDETIRSKLLAAMNEQIRLLGGPNAILFAKGGTVWPDIAGKYLSAIADEASKSPAEAALDIIQRGGRIRTISFRMNEGDIEEFMRQEWVMTGSDGGFGHPRMYGTFPRKIREYVFNRKILTLPAAIRASSALAAETFGLTGRGKIREGYFADIVVFDEATIADRATYEEPTILPNGIRFVLVNGRVVIDEGEYNGTLAGRTLRKR